MKKNILIFIFSLTFSISFSQQKQWKLTSAKEDNFSKKTLELRNDKPTEFKIYNLDYTSFKSKTLNKSNKIIELPTPNGIEKFVIEEASVLDLSLNKKFPNIKSYNAKLLENNKIKAKISIGIDGLHAAIYEPGKPTYYIDPFTKDNKNFIAYKRTSLEKEQQNFVCEVRELSNETNKNQFFNRNANDGLLRTYRLALACTGEYAQFHLNRLNVSNNASDNIKKEAVLSAMNTSITRINGVFERDLSVRFEIVSGNENIIFLDPNTDNLTNDDDSLLINESQNLCDSKIGNANYDIGHTFSTGVGGRAALGSVCIQGQKGQGVTGNNSPFGDTFDIDYVAHEIGHQMGANHTFNGTADNCAGINRNNNTAVEPGSGNTIMAYAGICSPQNVQNQSDDHFHAISIDEMWSIVITTGSCASTTTTGNTAPVANAGLDYTIPKSTPFILKGQGSDVDANNVLTYNWAQVDNGIGFAIPPNPTNTGGAMFKSLPSSTSPNRYMPSLPTVIAGNTSSTWEVVPSVAREMNFSLLVRDNNEGGGSSSRDDMVVTVVDASPFVITSQNTAVTWNTGSSEIITWNVGSTNTLPINCQKVNIKLSTDGGLTFPIILASNTQNDGSHTISVPENPTTKARILVEAADNIFYDVSNSNFTINSTVPTFAMANVSGNQQACNSNNDAASFIIGMNFVNGFNEDVSFTIANQPAGASINFSPSVINSDGNVTLEISNIIGAEAKDYNITVTGTSSSFTRTLDLVLEVYSNSFSGVSLISPGNNDTDISLTPILTFNEDNSASLYEVEVALDANFTNIIDQGVTSNSNYQVQTNLNDLTNYYWRVKPKNDCGEGVYSSVFKFTTEECIICDSYGNISYNTSTTLVQFNTINKSSSKPSGYSNYTSIATTVKRNSKHNLTVNVNTDDFEDEKYTVRTIVWIDWNQNCDFTDEGEVYDLGSTTGTSNGPTSLSPYEVTIPSNAVLGNTTMRIITKYFNHGLPTSCEINFDGETEDYTITVEDNPASIDDVAFEAFKLYPNPNKGNFNLQFDVINTEKVAIQLFDIRGRLVGEKNYFDTSSTFSETISFDKTVAGLYLLRIINGNVSTTRKLIIE